MNGTSFDAFARRTVATVSRRASLSALGAAALGAIAAPHRVEAGCRSRCNKRCSAQTPDCAAAVSSFCDTTSNPSGCLASCIGCCEGLRNCERSEVFAGTQCLLGCAP